MQVAAASTERNTNVATTFVELPMSRCWKKASAITPATHPPIRKYRMRFIDLLAVCDGAGCQLWRGGLKTGLLGSLNTRQGNSWDQHPRRRFEPCLVARNLLGAPGRAGPAHIMQFRPVGVECPDVEMVPESADVGEQTGFANASAGRGEVRF